MALPRTAVALVMGDGRAPASVGPSSRAIGGIPIDQLVPADEAATLLLVPPCLETGHNLSALVAWHRARGGGATLVADSGRWSGIAAIDRILFPDSRSGLDVWTPVALTTLANSGARAIAFPGMAPPAATLLDRDGTIIVDREYLADPEGVTLLPGAANGLALLAARGVTLVVITNQSGIGRGRFTQAQVEAVHLRLQELLGREGVSLGGIYVCPHRNDEGCHCRKPGDALARRAARELGLSLDRAVVVGDKPADIGLARRLGVPAFLVTTGHGATTLAKGDAPADYVVDGLDELARICTHPAGLAVPATLPPA